MGSFVLLPGCIVEQIAGELILTEDEWIDLGFEELLAEAEQEYADSGREEYDDPQILEDGPFGNKADL